MVEGLGDVGLADTRIRDVLKAGWVRQSMGMSLLKHPGRRSIFWSGKAAKSPQVQSNGNSKGYASLPFHARGYSDIVP